MYFKTALILAWFLLSYLALVFIPVAWWLAVPLAMSLGLSMAAIGFNIQHDGGHGAYSARTWVNRLMAMTLDLLGGSSYVWALKHNKIHHSYTNITGHDDDINVGLFGRLTPHQKRLGIHRLQHYYLWILYGLLPTKWQFYDDFRDILTGRIGARLFERPKTWNLVIFIGGKVVFFSLAFLFPILLHPVWAVLSLYAVASFVQGLVLSVIFQCAHCVEEASFPLPLKDSCRMETNWAVHQVETTVNFACASRLLSWLVGGLNFQIEHHLFPRICHVHYPAISRLVRPACETYGVRYIAYDSLWAVVASHWRWLRRMGMAPGA
jgi:linoleoyl-CoA desaturase